jgi:carboxylesterase
VKRTHVILLHGLCSTPDELLTIETALRAAGHGVTPMRIRGYSFEQGESEQPLMPFTDWLKAIAEEVARHQSSGQPVVLAGISAGATLALGALALCGPNLAGVVLMSTTLRYDGWAVPWYHFLMPIALYTPLGRFWRYRERPPYGVKNPRVRRWIERELESRKISCAGAAVIGVGHLREHDRLRRTVLAAMGQQSCARVLALHAVEDEVASPANLALLAPLKVRQMRQVLLPNSHHMISIDNDKAQVIRETLEFVSGIGAETRSSAH